MTVEIYISKKMRDEIYPICPKDEYAVPTRYQRERRVLEDYALSFHKNYE